MLFEFEYTINNIFSFILQCFSLQIMINSAFTWMFSIFFGLELLINITSFIIKCSIGSSNLSLFWHILKHLTQIMRIKNSKRIFYELDIISLIFELSQARNLGKVTRHEQ